MRRFPVGAIALGMMAVSATAFLVPGGASASGSGSASVAQATELNCSLLDVKALLDTDLTGMSDNDLRARVGQVITLADRALKTAANSALDGTIDDVRTFLQTGWHSPYKTDLRVRINVILSTAGPEVRAEANAALDADTDEALEAFLRKESCKPRDPATTPTTAPASNQPATTSTVPQQPGVGAVAPPATPVQGRPGYTG